MKLDQKPAIKALFKSAKAELTEDPSSRIPVHVNVTTTPNTNVRLPGQRGMNNISVPYVIPLPHKVHKSISQAKILLIVPHPTAKYAELFQADDASTKDTFADIISVKKFRPKLRKDPINVGKDFDLIVADSRIHEEVVECYDRLSKKISLRHMPKPHPIRFIQPGKEDDARDANMYVDPDYVKAQVRGILRSTSVTLPRTMACEQGAVNLTALVGYLPDNTAKEIEANVLRATHNIVDNLVESPRTIKAVHIKSPKTIGLPVWRLEREGKELFKEQD